MARRPGDIVTLFVVRENSDKTEGRGRTINTWYFEREEDAKKKAKRLGAMGTDETVWREKFFVGSDGALRSSAESNEIPDDLILTADEMTAVTEALRKLSTYEVKALRKYGKMVL